MPPVVLSSRLTDQTHGRPVVQGLRDLATVANQHDHALQALITQVNGIQVPTIAQIRAALQASGSDPLNITQLVPIQSAGGGSSGAILFGLHANRLSIPTTKLPDGSVFFETDRMALYLWDKATGNWFLLGNFIAAGAGLASHPSDLGTNDNGYLFFAKDKGYIQRWSGAAWHYNHGIILDTLANRPTFGSGLVDGGMLFVATDHGYQTWEMQSASGWLLFPGWGEPTRGVLASITTGLGATDVGYEYYATDYDRVYRWSGAAWADAPGQPSRGMLTSFGPVAAPTGWALCDGSTVTRSTATGGTTPVVTPNFVSGGSPGGVPCFPRGGSPYSGTPGGAVASATTDNDTDVGVNILSAGAVLVALNPHQHTISDTGGGALSDLQPPYIDAPVYLRL